MAQATVGFDHVHLVAKDAHATANWYVDKLGGEVRKVSKSKARRRFTCRSTVSS